MASVFLSYDHEDSTLARPIAVALEKAGHSVWFDRHIHGGAQYSRKIEEALDEADAVVVLWSPRSLESAWVRDEAAEGRDRGKLVPLRVGGVSPPMGFRQFQTIDLGHWRGRGRVPHFTELLEAVQSQAATHVDPPKPVEPPPPAGRPFPRRWFAAALAFVLIAAAGFGLWKWFGRGKLPVVEVASANRSPRSQTIASDLFVKLGTLAQVGEGKWKLVDAASAPAKPDLVFRTADTGSANQPQANLVLLDGNDDSLLWSREFTFPAGGAADLRQRMALTAGRVLGCALESRDAGGLPRDLLKLFLNTCATIAETSADNPTTITEPLRKIVTAMPRFTPAWGRLLLADTNVIDVAGFTAGDVDSAIHQLRADLEKARAIDPELPEITIGEIRLLAPTAYAERLNLLQKTAVRAPDKPQIFADQSLAFQQVGRMFDAVQSAQRAAALDPLSPALTTQYIMTLAHSGQLARAREELSRSEKLWAGTESLRDALWAFNLRYGDPEIARKYANFDDEGLRLYLHARADPSPANVDKLVLTIRQWTPRANAADWGWPTQALNEFGHVDEAYAWFARTTVPALAQDSYLLFRPGYANVRKDSRFIRLAKRIGLVDYWRSSGKWPDFCSAPDLPYECKAEAAKYAA